jgi:uncharacterized protein YecT (DUF1311 family)
MNGKQMTAWLSFTVLLAGATPGIAAAALDCSKAETQAELDLCAGKELKDADAQLDRTYKTLASELTDVKAKAALADAERTWESYRDTECKFESSRAFGGTAEQMALAYCEGQRARTRINVLKRILNCKEGDMTCPAMHK